MFFFFFVCVWLVFLLFLSFYSSLAFLFLSFCFSSSVSLRSLVRRTSFISAYVASLSLSLPLPIVLNNQKRDQHPHTRARTPAALPQFYKLSHMPSQKLLVFRDAPAFIHLSAVACKGETKAALLVRNPRNSISRDTNLTSLNRNINVKKPLQVGSPRQTSVQLQVRSAAVAAARAAAATAAWVGSLNTPEVLDVGDFYEAEATTGDLLARTCAAAPCRWS
jgi:hypothetical protein